MGWMGLQLAGCKPRETKMARFVALEAGGTTKYTVWVNVENVTVVGAGNKSTAIYFDKENSIDVNEPAERVMMLFKAS